MSDIKTLNRYNVFKTLSSHFFQDEKNSYCLNTLTCLPAVMTTTGIPMSKKVIKLKYYSLLLLASINIKCF